MSTVFIYALKEPDTGEIRYVGQSGDPQDRFRQHCGTKEKCHRGNWIRALKKSGQKPILEIVDEAPYEFRGPIEAAYVQFFREQGCNLVNGTPGGEDPPGMLGKTHSPETRKKMCGKRGPLSEETKQKQSLAQKGNKKAANRIWKPESIRKLSVCRLGKKRGVNTTSRFVGVCWDCYAWKAQLQVPGRQLKLGRYESEEDAAHVYDWVAKLYFGESARVNFP